MSLLLPLDLILCAGVSTELSTSEGVCSASLLLPLDLVLCAGVSSELTTSEGVCSTSLLLPLDHVLGVLVDCVPFFPLVAACEGLLFLDLVHRAGDSVGDEDVLFLLPAFFLTSCLNKILAGAELLLLVFPVFFFPTFPE
jgi:hypothetical protein